MTDVPSDWNKARAWYAVAVLSLAYAISIVDRLIMPISIQAVRRSLGLSDVGISLMMGLAFATFYSLCGLPLGALVDRCSRRAVIFAGMLVWSLAAMGSGLAKTPAELFVARMLVGAGEAALSPAAYSILADLFPKRRLAAPVSVFVAGGTLGSAAALAGGGALLQYFTLHGGLSVPGYGRLEPWQSLYFCAGLPGLAFLGLIRSLPEPGRQPLSRPAGAAARGPALLPFLLRRPRLFALLFVGFGAAAMLPYGYQSWIPALMMRSYGASPAEAGRTFGLLVAACGLLAHGSNGFIVDALFRRGMTDAHLRYFVWTALAAAPIAAFGFLHGGWLWLAAAVLATHLLLTPFVGYAGAALQIITPAQLRGRMSALYLFVVSAIGLGFGPTAVALIDAHLPQAWRGLGAALAVFTLLCAGTGVVLLSLARPRFRNAVAEDAPAAQPREAACAANA